MIKAVTLNNLHPAKGSKHRKKIVGRGVGSGHGRTSTRGSKGQKSRSGDGSKKVGFEGGQMPIFRRLPKRGFSSSKINKNYNIVNVEDLNKFDENCIVTLDELKKKRLINKKKYVKILGNGNLKKSLIVKANNFSKSAIFKIESLGGKIEVIK
ncbi:MAG: 50S ribosomal protein L15 [Endomicrobium sp.]|jgi:large subunit ribosomal protein L15|nr:50S ribosomal protein L15 [Endomicrobium sp.]